MKEVILHNHWTVYKVNLKSSQNNDERNQIIGEL